MHYIGGHICPLQLISVPASIQKGFLAARGCNSRICIQWCLFGRKRSQYVSVLSSGAIAQQEIPLFLWTFAVGDHILAFAVDSTFVFDLLKCPEQSLLHSQHVVPERSCLILPLLVAVSTGRKSLYQEISGSGFPLAAQSMVAVRVFSTTLSWGPMSIMGNPWGSCSSAKQKWPQC